MEVENQRLERSKGVLRVLTGRFSVECTLNLSHLVQHQVFLEGTAGSHQPDSHSNRNHEYGDDNGVLISWSENFQAVIG